MMIPGLSALFMRRREGRADRKAVGVGGVGRADKLDSDDEGQHRLDRDGDEGEQCAP